MRRLVLVIHNVRSAHNVGSLLRTAEGLGIDKVYMAGFSPYPAEDNDSRLPHIRQRLSRQINKTALGAEESIDWEHQADLRLLIPKLRADGFIVLALEQTPNSTDLRQYQPPGDIALIVGNEVDGVDEEALAAGDGAVAIPMAGSKESFNVAAAGAMALYHFKYASSCLDR